MLRPHRHPKLKLLLYFLNNWLSIYKHREPERKVNERMAYKPGFGVACLPDQGLYEQLPMKFPALPILPGISREPEKSRPARTSSLPAGGSTYGSQEQTLIPDSLQRHGQPCWSVPEPQHKVSHNTKIRNNIYCFLLKLGALTEKECAKRAFLRYGFHLPRRLGLSSLE